MAENNKYVFISYAHRDEDIVMPIINNLRNGGIRLWYDNGIEAGSEWPEYIAGKIMNCDRILCFISKAYLESQNCKRELNFAISEKKELLSVFIEDVALTAGMKMQLGSYQALYLRRYRSVNSFSEGLIREKFLASCRDLKKYNPQRTVTRKITPPPAKTETRTAGKAPSEKKESKQNTKYPYMYLIFTLIMALFCVSPIISILGSGNVFSFGVIQGMVYVVLLTLLNIFFAWCIVSPQAKIRRFVISLFGMVAVIGANLLIYSVAQAFMTGKFAAFLIALVANVIAEFLVIAIMSITDASTSK